jgi:uncharacterized membrane protein
MESRYKLLGHPIHVMLIPYPLALLSTAAVFDVIGFVTGDGTWHTASFWMISAGLLVGLGAALFGLLDWLNVPRGTRARSVGLLHGTGNAVMVVLFALSWLLRLPDPAGASPLAVLLALAGAGILAVTGWLGGELPYRLGIGIDAGAHPNASSSLSSEPIQAGEHVIGS